LEFFVTVSSFLIPQIACFLLLGAFVVEKLFLAIARAADGYEDDSGFHWEDSGQATVCVPPAVAPF